MSCVSRFEGELPIFPADERGGAIGVVKRPVGKMVMKCPVASTTATMLHYGKTVRNRFEGICKMAVWIDAIDKARR